LNTHSDKPSPRAGGLEHNQIYNIENWAAECADFAQEVIGEPVYAVGNSLGGLLALQMARARPQLVRGLLLIDPAVRMQHVKKQVGNLLRV
jgi:pimeloyl-ACP methyl ester carboxylesterase